MNNKILIVEDEFIVANDLRLILQLAGYKIIGIADSLEEAAEKIKKEIPDLVLLDIQLKGKSTGIDLARNLKTENIAFVYLSAYSSQKILEEAKTTEPYGFLVKPFRENDLLVTLEIALYRHKHSLESKKRREDLLHKQLKELANKKSDQAQFLLDLGKLLQSYVPFDLVSFGIRPNEQLQDIGYLRIGYDEYQFIGEKELMTITGLKKNALSAIVAASKTDTIAAIYHDEATKETKNIPSLPKILIDTFKLQSYLVCPVRLSNGLLVNYFFYSRQNDLYNAHHLNILNYLQACLIELTEKRIYDKTVTGATPDQPGYTDRKQPRSENHPVFNSIIGNHHLLLAALDLVAQVAPYNTSVLILGESGTGKEKIAESIHTISPRKNGPFIKVNCAAIPTTLIESELFGHEKGAFTGAIEKRKGKFQQAEGGTIFLDEIGELPLDMQAKLLRVLQEKEIEPIGGSSTLKVNVRIVAATNRNLEKEISDGNFRLDLYYRLNVFPISLPPLRERKSDIEALTIFFAKKFCKEFNKPFIGVEASMKEEMYDYTWPGNIREMENVLEQAVILNDGKSPLKLKRSLVGRPELIS